MRRFSLVTALLAGFGRAAAEVGAIIIVGGNIDGFTRTMTTAIALETSKGDLPLAIGLGMVLIAIVVVVNAAAWGAAARRRTIGGMTHARTRHRSADRASKMSSVVAGGVTILDRHLARACGRRTDGPDRAERLPARPHCFASPWA